MATAGLAVTSEVVSSYEMGTRERLAVVRHRYAPAGLDVNAAQASDIPRLCLVTGIHGDELEGQYLCYEVARCIREHPEHLAGVVDIYPAINPLGVGAISRGIPQFDLDMNRIFPGNNAASPYEAMAADVIASLRGATLVVDVHASNIYLREIPQIRVNEIVRERLMPWALASGAEFVWVHADATVLRGTLAYSLNDLDTPTLVLEMGVGMRITQGYGQELADGFMNLMRKAGAWTGPVAPVRRPIVSTDGQVSFLNAEAAGLFAPQAAHDRQVKKGQVIGRILEPAEGRVLEELRSPVDGLLFTLREYPIVYPGSLIARVLGPNGEA